MKRLTVGLMLGALCCMLFTTPLYPLQYDPHRPPGNIPVPIPGSNYGVDDIGWEETVQAPCIHPDEFMTTGIFRCFVRTLPFGYFIEALHTQRPSAVPDSTKAGSEEQTNGVNR